MSNPKWVTKAGVLGIFQEENLIDVTITATSNNSNNSVIYTILNGDFPESTNISTRFQINQFTGRITVTPSAVSKESIYDFTIRAKEIDINNNVVGFNDRTFRLIVQGADNPEFITPEGELFPDPTYLNDSDYCEYQILFVNKDPGIIPDLSLVLGSLPPGLQIDKLGLIRGYPDKPVDENNQPIIKTYNFTLQLTTTTGTTLGNFSITVKNQNLNEDFIGRKPAIINIHPLSLPIQESDQNYPYYALNNIVTNNFQEDNFVFKIIGKSFDNNPISFKYNSRFNLPILGTLQGTNYLVTTDTGLLSLGQKIEFLPEVVGGLLPEKIYYVREIIDKNYFKISNIPNGSIVELETSNQLMYADLKLPPGIFDYINYTNQHIKLTIVNSGENYNPGDKIKISGEQIGGSTPYNDLTIDIKEVSDTIIFDMDTLLGINTQGNLYLENIEPESVTGTGEGLVVNIEKIGAEWITGKFDDLPSIIDKYTMTFIAIDTVTGIESESAEIDFIVANKTLTSNLETDIVWETDSNLGVLSVGETSVLKLRANTNSKLINLNYRILYPTIYSIEDEIIFIASNTSYLVEGQPIKIIKKINNVTNDSYPVFSNADLNKIYYVKKIYGNIRFSISETIDGDEFVLGQGSGEMSVEILLPPNLKLLSNGDISGKVDFQLDTNLFLFNEIKIYQFPVEVYSERYPEISQIKVFTLNIVNDKEKPYENIYLKAFLNQQSRSELLDILWDFEIFPEHIIYRKLDKNFGRSLNIMIGHLSGLKVTDIESYITYINNNHYNKRLILGPVETALAINDKNEIVYEVVFSRLVDNFVNKDGLSISKQITWPRPIPNSSRILYPNSLLNMKQQINENIVNTADTSILPLWMRTIQRNKRSLGFVPCWVLCYTKPNFSQQVASKFNNKYTLNQFDVEIDRLIVDRSLTHNFTPEQQQWFSLPSSGVDDDSKDSYVYFNKKNILN